jgi:DNA-directed RNA polymerase subunit RPC12/RpoP
MEQEMTGDGWLKTGSHTRCPKCLSVDGLEVRRDFRAKPLGSFSIAGAQMKVVGGFAWQYRCTACGATGDAQPKTPEEHGKWTDGLGSEPYE